MGASVLYYPGNSPNRREDGEDFSVLCITVHLGKCPSDEEHLAVQALLAAVKRLQELRQT